MDKFTENYVKSFMAGLVARNPGEVEFHQAVGEVVNNVASYVVANPHLMDQKILMTLLGKSGLKATSMWIVRATRSASHRPSRYFTMRGIS